MLHAADYLFESKRLMDAFDECLERAGNNSSMNIKCSIDDNITTKLVDDVSAFDYEGRDDIFAVSEDDVENTLEEILDAAGVADYIIKNALQHEGVYLADGSQDEREYHVPAILFAGDFHVSDVDGLDEGNRLASISVSNDDDVAKTLSAIMDADSAFEFWNDVVEPLGLDNKIIEKLEAAGIDPATQDHAGGDKANDRSYYDLYYPNPNYLVSEETADAVLKVRFSTRQRLGVMKEQHAWKTMDAAIITLINAYPGTKVSLGSTDTEIMRLFIGKPLAFEQSLIDSIDCWYPVVDQKTMMITGWADMNDPEFNETYTIVNDEYVV